LVDDRNLPIRGYQVTETAPFPLTTLDAVASNRRAAMYGVCGWDSGQQHFGAEV